ncbi:restriction endonuclease subunit S [Bifidobacterium pseudolongum]|uniref:restriction endonuclease subunit S n=1 Tax=Bifidobacterium pseudolongum TaxID=1694 RepID=UPI00102226A1|nr:restriction endonuclease subunit S [Bifidobacterium pseudolongum]RYQ76063.1 type I restriction modification DNA specificity domain-containing protein [Bifidobacterium pseudolongum subsp. globosum]
MMSAKNLRDSILQMAVEGKLVEQREEEGTAADLLASIREQRAQLVREKKAKPLKGGESVIWRDDDGHWFERRGKGGPVCIDDEIPFDIPDSWCWARLMSFSLILNGDRGKNYPSKSKLHDDAGIPFVSAVNIKNGTIDSSNLKYLDEQQYEALNAGKLMQSDILFCIRGSLGKCGVYPYEQGAIASSLVILRQMGSDVDANLVEKSYLLFLLASPLTFVQIRKMQNGTAQPNLSAAVLGDFLYPIPPFAEQKRIIEKTDEIKPFVDEYGRAHEQREQLDRELPIKLRKSILQAAVEGKLTEQSDDDEPASLLLAGIREKRAQLVREGKAKPVKGGESIIYRDDAGHWFERRGKSDPVCIDEEIPFDIPDSWCWARLGAVTTYVQRGKSPKYSSIEKYPVVAQKCNQWSGFSLEKAKFIDPTTLAAYDTERYLQDGDLLWNSTGLGTLGRMAVYQSEVNPYELAVADSHVTVIRTIVNWMSYRYLFFYFAGPSVQSTIESKSSGTTKQKELAVSTVLNYLVPVPPLAEQHRIVEKVDAVLNRVNELV